MASNLDIGPRQSSTLDIGPIQSAASTPINTALADNQGGNWGDSIASQLFDATTLNVIITGDQFSLTDDVSFNMFVSDVALSDTRTLSDAIAFDVLPVVLSVTLSDTITLSDSIQVSLALFQIEINDFWVLSDSTTLVTNAGGQFGDAIVLSDSLTIQLDGAGVTIADTLSLTDSLNVQMNVVRTITLADTFVFSDSISEPLMSDTFISYIRQYLNDVI